MAPRKPPKGKVTQFPGPIKTKHEPVLVPAKPVEKYPTVEIPWEEIPSWETHGVVIPPLPNPRPPHRPDLLTQRVADILIHVIGTGSPKNAAAAAAGIKVETLYEWMRKGRAGDLQYQPLQQALEERRAAVHVRIANRVVQDALDGNQQAQQFYLSTQHADQWGQKHVLEVKLKGEFEAFFALLKSRLPASVFEQVLLAAADPAPALPPPTVTNIEDAD